VEYIFSALLRLAERLGIKDGLRTDWGLKIFVQLKEVVTMVGNGATIIGFIIYLLSVLLSSVDPLQLVGVKL